MACSLLSHRCIIKESIYGKSLNQFGSDYYQVKKFNCRSQWPRSLRCRSAAAHLLRSWFQIPPRAWMFVCWDCCVLSGRGLCDELITRPEESYRPWCVVVCDLETSRMRRPWPTGGCSATEKKIKSNLWVKTDRWARKVMTQVRPPAKPLEILSSILRW